jgi:hypothetical protein
MRFAVLAQLLLVGLSFAAPKLDSSNNQVVITVHPADERSEALRASDVAVVQGSTSASVIHLDRLAGDLADMQLFVLLDDSSRSASLSLQYPQLRAFLEALPATTQVALGYMRNGSFGQVQPFTADHHKIASSLRLPASIPGENGSPYFALADLAKHWPSKQPANRRVVLMLTDGVDPYYNAATVEDPYLDTAVREALKAGVMVYPIYIRGAGSDGGRGWITNIAQSRLIEVSQETGGTAYFQGFSDPVTIAPFLKDLQERLANQYKVTVASASPKGVRSIKLQSGLLGLKLEGPTRMYVH